jgi:hypothetical protein
VDLVDLVDVVDTVDTVDIIARALTRDCTIRCSAPGRVRPFAGVGRPSSACDEELQVICDAFRLAACGLPVYGFFG